MKRIVEVLIDPDLRNGRMKFYEWILTIVCVILIYTGLALWSQNLGMAVGVFLLAAVLFLGYMYFVKDRPMKLIREIFVSSVIAEGFRAAKDKPIRRDVSNAIKQFPGFDDLFFSLEDLYLLEQERRRYFAGEYSISGYGFNRGYFLLIDLANTELPSVRLSRIIDKIDKFDERSEQALAHLPDEIIKLIRTFPYDLHCIDRHWLFDFDTRNLDKRSFQDSFNQALSVFKMEKL
jgi:hypothetical protein